MARKKSSKKSKKSSASQLRGHVKDLAKGAIIDYSADLGNSFIKKGRLTKEDIKRAGINTAKSAVRAAVIKSANIGTEKALIYSSKKLAGKAAGKFMSKAGGPIASSVVGSVLALTDNDLSGGQKTYQVAKSATIATLTICFPAAGVAIFAADVLSSFFE